MDNTVTTFLFNCLFYGFCFTTFISYCLSFSKSEKLSHFNTSFFQYAIKTIRIIAIAYFIYSLFELIIYFYFKDHTLFSNRATGPYWFAYWIMLLRPFVFCLLIQLLWFKKFQKKSLLNFILVLIILFIVLASGTNLERFIIIVTSFHRDYLPSGFNHSNDGINWFLLFLIAIIERILLFVILVLGVQFFHKKRIKNKN